MVSATEEDSEGNTGVFAIEHEELWSDNNDDLPELWFNERRNTRVIKKDYLPFRPKMYTVKPDGNINDEGEDNGIQGWFQPIPFLICLRCRAVYDKRQGDYRKLSSLSQTGAIHRNNGSSECGSGRYGRSGFTCSRDQGLELHRQPPGCLTTGWTPQRLRSSSHATCRPCGSHQQE